MFHLTLKLAVLVECEGASVSFLKYFYAACLQCLPKQLNLIQLGHSVDVSHNIVCEHGAELWRGQFRAYPNSRCQTPRPLLTALMDSLCTNITCDCK
mgnify:CR=1 FL=1